MVASSLALINNAPSAATLISVSIAKKVPERINYIALTVIG